MNEREFKEKWLEEKPLYKAWGDFVVNEISKGLRELEIDLQSFLKIPVNLRVKDDINLIDKAFHRADKSYDDPYNQIEDKVGARFVVLLVEDIEIIQDVIQGSNHWSFDPCKHFDIDREKSPLLFTYQSVHYIIHPKKNGMKIDGYNLDENIKCEVQIRTLLQHAHAELTHDQIYKSKKEIKPQIYRTVAKSMALIETTDGFFGDVSKMLHHGPLEDLQVLSRLDNLYQLHTGLTPNSQKSSISIWDEFEDLIDESLIDSINDFIKEKMPYLRQLVSKKYTENSFYQQSVILFIYWMLENHKRRLIRDWPLQSNILQPLANDLGKSLSAE